MIRKILRLVAIVALVGLSYTVGKDAGLRLGNKVGHSEGRDEGLLDACQQSVVGLRNQAAMFGMTMRGQLKCRIDNDNAVMDLLDDKGNVAVTVHLNLETVK